jgi:dipeptidyl aminopeptidase/acylaminoacyl peptidase
MVNYFKSRNLKQKGLFVVMALAVLIPLMPARPDPNAPADNTPIVRANYDLAARWTTTKVGKLVFDTSVTPRWLEGDRFWYAYLTPAGRNFYLVDPAKKSKTLLFDNAKMAAMLTTITRIPYDAQHLPFTTIQKFVKKDTAFQFQFSVPIDADIVTTKKVDQQAQKTDQTTQTQQTGQRGQTQGQRGQGARGGAPAAPRTKTLHFEYDLTTQKVQLLEDWKDPETKPGWANVSPDGKTILFARNHNLYMMDDVNYEKAKKDVNNTDKTIVENQLTTDGVEYYSFGGRGGRGGGDQQQEQQQDVTTEQGQGEGRGNARTAASGVQWSKDSKKFSVSRRDSRKVENLWVINTLANPRPTLMTYRYAMPGEANVPQTEVLTLDRDTKARVKVKADAWKDENMNVLSARVTASFQEQNPDRTEQTWFTDAPDKLYLTRISRDMHKLDMCVVNPETGDTKVLFEERLNTYIETQTPRLINNGQEFIWWSERDGWGHLYRYGIDGTLKNQITSGEFVCVAAGGGGGGGRGGGGAVQGIDEKAGALFFTSVGREPGEDPYYPHLYRINLDGAGLKLLNPGDANHSVNMCESTKYFVDNSSRVNATPRSVLYDNAGNLVMDLETTDLKPLLAAGYKFPEPFKVKADDGITDLYGVMYKPFDFDPAKKYPIILYVYPGPQTESVTKTFTRGNYSTFLAQFGFIVIEVGNRGGNPQRSKWYHNYSYGEDISFRDYGLVDKKAAVEQLAHRFAFIDINKVGIWGHSGGGFMSAAAMLVFPDFFKVAWSESGNHENNVYNNTWSEKNHGIKEVTDDKGTTTFEFTIDKNSDLARNLKGHLMLTTGDYDNNVHPANTMRLADALIRANKRFDMMIFPGMPHSYGRDGDYCNWIRADYFCKWLLGDFDSNVDLVQLAREQEQTGREATQTGGRGGGRGRGGN